MSERGDKIMGQGRKKRLGRKGLSEARSLETCFWPFGMPIFQAGPFDVPFGVVLNIMGTIFLVRRETSTFIS